MAFTYLSLTYFTAGNRTKEGWAACSHRSQTGEAGTGAKGRRLIQVPPNGEDDGLPSVFLLEPRFFQGQGVEGVFPIQLSLQLLTHLGPSLFTFPALGEPGPDPFLFPALSPLSVRTSPCHRLGQWKRLPSTPTDW